MQTHTRLIGTAVALLIAFGVGAPTVDSRAPARGLKDGSVTIHRDEYGVPHVFGSTLEAVWFGVGYAQGQDRLWQAELLRRSATGTSAEILGPSALSADVFARTLFGPRQRRDALFDGAAPETKIIFTSFVAGLNAWIDEAAQTGALPPEYAAFGVAPRPWTTDDVIAQAMLLLRNLGEFGDDELSSAAALQELIARFGVSGGQKVFLDTHWSNDPLATTSVPSGGAVNAMRHSAAATPATWLPSGVDEALAEFTAAKDAWARHLQTAGLSSTPKSNAIVVAPKLTVDGRALLLGGPQMGYSVPQINHEIGIHGAGFDVTGMNIAGLPGVPVGVGKEHAWTITSGVSKNLYLYAERLNAQGQYLFDGALRDLDCRVETILVRGAASVVRPVCESVHGPVVGTASGVAFALKSAVRGLEIQGVEAFHDMMRAGSYKEFAAALPRAVYNFNVLYADARGNIAYWHVGRIPIPAAADTIWLPHDGTGSAEWQGFVPFDEMPHSLNPDQGWLASWNNKPAPDWPNSVSGFGTFGPVHRVNTLTALMQQQLPGNVSAATLEQINRTAGSTTDTPSGTPFNVFVSTMLADMLSQVNVSADARLAAAVTLLRAWDWRQVDEDGDGFYDAPAVPLFNSWWQAMSERIFRDDLGSAFQANVVANLAHRLVTGNAGVPLLHDYLGSETIEQAVTASLVTALDGLQGRFGSGNPVAWRQPIATIPWPPIGLGRVAPTIWMNRGTYNQIVHLGMGPELFGRNVVAPGQSGVPGSPHFSDQLDLYATWRYKPMRLDREDLRGHIESTVTIQADRRD